MVYKIKKIGSDFSRKGARDWHRVSYFLNHYTILPYGREMKNGMTLSGSSKAMIFVGLPFVYNKICLLLRVNHHVLKRRVLNYHSPYTKNLSRILLNLLLRN